MTAFEQARILLKQHKIAEVVELCTQAIRENSDYDEAYLLRGIARSVRDIDGAILDYSEALRLNPTLAKAYNARGLAYNEKGDYAVALADYDDAIRLDPDRAIFYSNRAATYRNQGNFDAAITDYTEAIRLDPQNPYPYYTRGMVYQMKGMYAQAIDDLQRYLDLGRNITRIEEQINNLRK